LKGYYTINKKGQIYCIDFIKNYKTDVNETRKKRNLNFFRRSVIENPDDTKNALKQDIEEHEKKARSASELQSPKTKKLGES
jgi:hypothetical protein